MAVTRKKAEKNSADQMMLQVVASLIRDFQRNFDDYGFCSSVLAETRQGTVPVLRQVLPAPTSEMDPAKFKAVYQIQSVVKRYRFQKDTYSDQELTLKAIDGFKATQSRLADVDLDKLDAKSQLVLSVAARYISKVLGMYSDEEHRSLCRFGRRASVGIPARSACEAARWELPISGSQEQIDWFDSEMSQVDSVQEYWLNQLTSDPSRSVYQPTSSLKLTLVPKTFKSYRSIMPNTTIGSYMSYGLGEMIRKRLKREGYDISSLQMRHRYLARMASMHNLHTTADLSSASDCITRALVQRLFPKDWFEILDQSRIKNVELPDSTVIESLTFCTMGIGYTFPLQTLVFLALLKAIQAVHYDSKDRRTISVYGDDMIYASRMHDLVVHYFTRFGFVINLDKTFHEGDFRESCGGDYYRGVDVRPFQPQNGSAFVGNKAYEAMLYKFVNGLLARWSEHEIGLTLSFLTSEIERVTGCCKLVPQNFPDDSGIKCHTLASRDKYLDAVKCARPKHVGHGVYRFSYLRLVSDLREEVRHEPYYWSSLRDLAPQVDFHTCGSLVECSSSLQRLIDQSVGVLEVEPPLITKELKPVQTFRSKISGRRLRRTSTFVTVSHTGRYTRQSGLSCFESRR